MEKLVKKAMKGDKDAFAELIKLNTQSLYKTAWVYLKNDCDAADAVQDTILACYEKISSLRNAKFFKTWMIRVLINKCNDILRRNQIYQPLEEYEAETRDSEMELCEWKELLKCLDQTSQEIVLLYYFEDMAVKEIAEVLDMNKNTVTTKLDRARKKLREEL